MLQAVDVAKAVRMPSGETLTILRAASLRVEPGTTTAVTGRSGSGKSTLLHGLALLDRFDHGSYTIDGTRTEDLDDDAASRLRGRTFGFVFQQFYLFDRLTALENVIAPAQHGPTDALRAARRRGEELLDRVGLAGRKDYLPSKLSGGEQQRVAIARCLIRQPRYILADEPTGSLDPDTASEVLELLIGMAKVENCGLLIVSHDDEVVSKADVTLTLSHGTVGDGR